MRKKLSLCAFVLITLWSCAGQRGPETFRVFENQDATLRIDIVSGDGDGGHGSAVVLTKDGYLLTNHHVTGHDGRKLLVNIAEGDHPAVAYPARLVAWDEDPVVDLAVVKIDRRFASAVILGDIRDVHPLDRVYNIGFPYGIGEMMGMGYVKALDADLGKIGHKMLLDIADGPGTSGSGIYLARNGTLIGIMQGLVSLGPTDGRQVVIRFAIPITVVRAFLDRVQVPYLAVFSFVKTPHRAWYT